MNEIKKGDFVTVGKGKSVHIAGEIGTLCSSNNKSQRRKSNANAPTCKRCCEISDGGYFAAIWNG